MSILNGGGFGPRIENNDGSYDVYSIQGTVSVKDDVPIFGNEEAFRNIALHEFSHSFVNQLTEENLAEVNKYSKLYDPLKEKMMKKAYNNWETCVNEHIVRAVVARFNYIQSGKEAYDKYIDFEKRNEFLYIEALDEKLVEYENNRNKYKSFREFYPELIKVFEKLN